MIQPTHADLWRLAAAEHRAPAPDDCGADEDGMATIEYRVVSADTEDGFDDSEDGFIYRALMGLHRQCMAGERRLYTLEEVEAARAAGAVDDGMGVDDDTRAADLADRGVTVRSGVRNRGPRSTGAV